ncbi:Nif11-like leader peptide family natural product precursor, partial [Prochlorococcus sp. P1344]|uniref:Nif11-like leader peptide family natural product precursor n=1 Tax=Prochlorococcus sp. P1344 TaxID=2729591 RepID=UPI001F1012F7
QADTSLQEQLKAEGADPVAIAKAAGFSITTEDLNTQRQTLSDDELEGVAGGGGLDTRDQCDSAYTIVYSACVDIPC